MKLLVLLVAAAAASPLEPADSQAVAVEAAEAGADREAKRE